MTRAARKLVKAAVPIAAVFGETLIPFGSVVGSAFVSKYGDELHWLTAGAREAGAEFLAELAGDRVREAWNSFAGRHNAHLQRAAAVALAQASRTSSRTTTPTKSASRPGASV